jgi:hypothetical protein
VSANRLHSQGEEEAMKFFTPDLLIRFGSTDDAIADAASDEWEQVHAAYVTHLQRIRPDLPRGMRRLLRRYYLHDAKVLAVAADEKQFFSIFLELNKPQDKFLELKYRLVGNGKKPGFSLHRHSELAGESKPLGWWLYDELDVAGGDLAAFTHTILFTGGIELRLAFFQFTCSRVNFFVRPMNSAAEDTTDPLVSIPA